MILKKYFMKPNMETPMVLNIRFSKELDMHYWRLVKTEDVDSHMDILVFRDDCLRRYSNDSTIYEDVLYITEYDDGDLEARHLLTQIKKKAI
jgi:hypothetical protein